MENPKGLFASLFDFSFTSFVTSKLIKFIYGLSIIGAGFVALVLIISGFNVSVGIGVLTLFVVAPFAFVLMIIYARVSLEIVIVLFRIAEHTAEIAAQGRMKASQSDQGIA